MTKTWSEIFYNAHGQAKQIENQNAQIALQNSWLIESLTPYAKFIQDYPNNFFASIIQNLKSGTRTFEIPERAKHIIAQTLAKEVAKRGRKFDSKYQEVLDRINRKEK